MTKRQEVRFTNHSDATVFVARFSGVEKLRKVDLGDTYARTLRNEVILHQELHNGELILVNGAEHLAQSVLPGQTVTFRVPFPSGGQFDGQPRTQYITVWEDKERFDELFLDLNDKNIFEERWDQVIHNWEHIGDPDSPLLNKLTLGWYGKIREWTDDEPPPPDLLNEMESMYASRGFLALTQRSDQGGTGFDETSRRPDFWPPMECHYPVAPKAIEFKAPIIDISNDFRKNGIHGEIFALLHDGPPPEFPDDRFDEDKKAEFHTAMTAWLHPRSGHKYFAWKLHPNEASTSTRPAGTRNVTIGIYDDQLDSHFISIHVVPRTGKDTFGLVSTIGFVKDGISQPYIRISDLLAHTPDVFHRGHKSVDAPGGLHSIGAAGSIGFSNTENRNGQDVVTMNTVGHVNLEWRWREQPTTT